MRKSAIFTFVLVLVCSITSIYAQDKPATDSIGTKESAVVDSAVAKASDQIIVYYLHMNRRCATCGKLESYSKEAVETGFAEQLKDSTLVFRVENFESDGNEHFAKDYKLYSQSLILSRVRDDKEIEWKNLDKIWTLVHSKDEFMSYVRTEVRTFMESSGKN